MKQILTSSERDDLQSLLLDDGYLVLLKVIESNLRDIEARVLTYNLESGPEGLVIEKARAEGAAKLFVRIRELKTELLKKSKS